LAHSRSDCRRPPTPKRADIQQTGIGARAADIDAEIGLSILHMQN
jgi:hypothetical protein